MVYMIYEGTSHCKKGHQLLMLKPADVALVCLFIYLFIHFLLFHMIYLVSLKASISFTIYL